MAAARCRRCSLIPPGTHRRQHDEARSKKCFISIEASKHDSESRVGRLLSLARRPRLRQFLCSLPRREALVVGDVLAGGRRFQLDHCAVVLRVASDHDICSAVLGATPSSTLFWCFFFGLLWGVGGLTFGLTMRYLGLSLGMAIVMGLCAAFGTLMPPIFNGTFVSAGAGHHFRTGDSAWHRCLPRGYRDRGYWRVCTKSARCRSRRSRRPSRNSI